MSGFKAILVGPRRFSEAHTFLGLGFALVLLICCAMASAQTGGSTERGLLAGETSAGGPSPPASDGSEQKTQDQATQAAQLDRRGLGLTQAIDDANNVFERDWDATPGAAQFAAFGSVPDAKVSAVPPAICF